MRAPSSLAVAAFTLTLLASGVASAERAPPCGSRFATALADFATAGRDAREAIAAERFAAMASQHRMPRLAHLAREVAASAQAAELGAVHGALATLVRPTPVVSTTGACTRG